MYLAEAERVKISAWRCCRRATRTCRRRRRRRRSWDSAERREDRAARTDTALRRTGVTAACQPAANRQRRGYCCRCCCCCCCCDSGDRSGAKCLSACIVTQSQRPPATQRRPSSSLATHTHTYSSPALSPFSIRYSFARQSPSLPCCIIGCYLFIACKSTDFGTRASHFHIKPGTR